MSQTYFALLTAVGEAKLANAAALGTQLQISRMAVGDGNGNLPVPSRTQTALINERYRADLNELKVDTNNASQIIAELVIPETEGGYWLREMGLYDATGALIAVSNCPPSYKPQMAEGSGRTQVLRMMLIVSSTAAVQLKIDPSVVLATRAYADSLIAVHMAAADPHPQYQLRGSVVSLNVSTLISEAQLGILLLDASGGNRTFTLPAANAGLGVREVVLRRADTSANTLVLATSGTDKIMLDTIAEAAGSGSTELLFAGDYLRLRSDGTGKWWCVGQAQLPASLATGFTLFATAGVFTYTVPPVLRSGRRRALVKVRGGGGGGAGAASSANFNAAGGGGAGGGVAVKRIDLSGVPSVSVTVGSGGSAGPNGVTPGGTGGTSSFGAYCSATGGTAGNPATASTAVTGVGAGNDGGIGIGGDLNLRGGTGGNAISATPTVSGGSVAGGAGGACLDSGGSRVSSPVYGAGGGGNGTTSGNQTVSGQAGAPGAVTIEW